MQEEQQRAAEWTAHQLAVNTTLSTVNTTASDNINLNAALHMQVIYTLIGVLGISGNALVAGVLLQSPATRKSLTNVFIINQSCIDGTSSFFIVLSTFIRDVDMIESALGQELFCRLWLTNLPIWGIFVSSTYNMVAVTFERYSAIVHPLSHHRCFTKKKARIILVFVWLFGPAYNAVYMIPTAGMVDGECTVYSMWPSPQLHTVVGIITVLLQYFIPLGLIIYAYGRISMVLARSGARDMQSSKRAANGNRSIRLNRARRNVIKTLALVSACFVLCWSGNQIYYTMYNCGFDADFNSTFYHFTVIMVFCNCCINPFVYAAKYEQFRKAAQRVFCKTKECDGSTDLGSTNAHRHSNNNTAAALSRNRNGPADKTDCTETSNKMERHCRMLQRMTSDPILLSTDLSMGDISDCTSISTVSGHIALCTRL